MRTVFDISNMREYIVTVYKNTPAQDVVAGTATNPYFKGHIVEIAGQTDDDAAQYVVGMLGLTDADVVSIDSKIYSITGGFVHLMGS